MMQSYLEHLVIHSSLQIPRPSIMSGPACDKGDIDDAAEDGQFYSF